MLEPKHPRRFVVSGPIGSGKSLVGRLLAERGAVVVEADRLGHAVLEPDGEAHGAVAARWPSAVADGRIDRSLLAHVVFADPAELAALEAITHPHIASRIRKAADAAADAVFVVELPLTVDLLGEGWHRLVVIAPDDIRMARAVARGMNAADVRARMEAQDPARVWLEAADSVIVNDADIDHLEDLVARWWEDHVESPRDSQPRFPSH